MSPPLPVEQALDRILARCRLLGSERVPLEQAHGRILADDVRADLDLPPFDNSAVDGYAVRAAELADAPVTLPVIEGGMAGVEPSGLAPGHAAKIMTGAPLPVGADAVVMVEQTTSAEPGRVSFAAPIATGANVRPRGSDLERGEIVVAAGTSLRHPAIALLAAVGCARPEVARRPRVALISTGDELVDLTATPAPGQIRDSSLHALPAQLRAAGAEVARTAHAVDSPAAMEELFDGLTGLDLVITCGGVSMGERDFVRPVFERLGQVDFWQVAIKPGKPLLFGTLGEALFFGLPGNPVSSMVCLDVFVRPAIDALTGRRDGGRLRLRGLLTEPLRSDARRAEYVRVVARADESGLWQATPTGDQGSGRMCSMLGANAYAVVPAGQGDVAAGDPVAIELYDPGPGAAA